MIHYYFVIRKPIPYIPTETSVQSNVHRSTSTNLVCVDRLNQSQNRSEYFDLAQSSEDSSLVIKLLAMPTSHAAQRSSDGYLFDRFAIVGIISIIN